jgi:hypothetical protein
MVKGNGCFEYLLHYGIARVARTLMPANCPQSAMVIDGSAPGVVKLGRPQNLFKQLADRSVRPTRTRRASPRGWTAEAAVLHGLW